MITVVTVVYNGARSIEQCLASVAAQTVRPLQHLIVDGASQDGTPELVARTGSAHVTLLSEPDQGLYDALNKGVARARHDIVGLLHADDTFADNQVLADVACAFDSDPELDGVYGDLVFVSKTNPGLVRRYWRSGAPGRFDRGWMPPHPALFLRRRVYTHARPFRLDLDIAADYEFMLRALYLQRAKLAYIPRVLTRMQLGGKSTHPTNLVRKSLQDCKAWTMNGRPIQAPIAVACKNLRKLGQFFLRPEESKAEPPSL